MARARRLAAVLLAALLISGLVPLEASARSISSSSRFVASSSAGYSQKNHASRLKCSSCPRDSEGRIKRDPDAVREFKRLDPRPAYCPDCQVDHIIPLSRGGREDPSNMQWLPKAQHQDKTRRELGGIAHASRRSAGEGSRDEGHLVRGPA